MNRSDLSRLSVPAATIFVFIWFLAGGIGHFTATAFFTGIVPPGIPMPRDVVLVSGVFELLGAAGLLLPSWRREAGIGLFLLTLCVTPANVHMWLHPDLFPDFPAWTLSARLVIQVLFLACIWFSTQPRYAAQGH